MKEEMEVKWIIGHPGTGEPIECESFDFAMDKWFEGFNIPFRFENGVREDFAIACARVKIKLREKNHERI